MAFDFPSSPSVGQVYQGYTWDGTAWNVAASGGKYARFIFNPAAGTTVLSGPDAAGLTLAYTPGSVEVIINGVWVAYPDYTATDGTSITLGSATASGDLVYVYALSSFSVLDPLNVKKNYVVNSAMMVSQENGTTAGTTSGYFAADQFLTGFVGTTGTYSVAQVASPTPGGSPNRIRFTVTAADAAVAAGDLVYLSRQVIEGLRVADLMWGTAAAKSIIIRFGCKAPAGTYCVAVRNAAANRSYVAEYVISAGEANTDVVKSVIIPGDITGTWAKDNTSGFDIFWIGMCGTTFQQAAGSWSASGNIASANQFNIMATNGNVFELFDVGLYEGTVAPPYQVPDYPSEVSLCQRYYWKSFRPGVNPAQNAGFDGSIIAYSITANTIAVPLVRFPVAMRAPPTMTYYNPAAANAQWSTGGVNAQSSGAPAANENSFYVTTASAPTISAGSSTFIHATANARM